MKKIGLARVITVLSLLSCVSTSLFADEEKRGVGYENIELRNVTEFIKFTGQEPVFPEQFFSVLRSKVEALGEHRNLQVSVIGHSDSDRLSAASRAKWGSNLGLSKLRAENAVKEIQKRVNFPGASFASNGVGASEPLVPNDTSVNKAKNRRGEVHLSYEKPIYEVIKTEAPKPAPAPVETPTSQAGRQIDQAKEALAQTVEDEDANTLEEALTAVDENYSLIKKGNYGLQYGYNFTYSSADAIAFNPDNNTVNGVNRDSRFTHTSTLSASYGLKNNLTLGLSLPLIATTRAAGSAESEIEDTGLGDIGVNLRWQPWPLRLGKPNVTFSGAMTLPTGTDPFKIDVNNSVATGSGTFGFSFSANASKTIDPVIAYGSVSLGYSLPRDGLNQRRDNSQTLVSVEPRPTFSYNVGIGYALSYGVSINMGFQHTFGSRTELGFTNGTSEASNADITSFESIGGHTALFNISTGFRTSPGTVLSINLGIGLTRESPDFVIGLSLPFSVEGLKSYFVEDE